LLECEFEVLRKLLVPVIELGGESRQLLEREVVRGCRRINLFQDFGQDPGSPEQSEGVGEPSSLARKTRLKALFGNILIVGIRWELGVDVLFFQKFRQAKDGSREAGTVRGKRPENRSSGTHQSSV
jgi:hypothetical protein